MPKVSTAVSKTIAPPVMGWNTYDAISAMDPSYAIEAINFFTNTGSSVDLRKGYTHLTTTFGAGTALYLFNYGDTHLIASGFQGRIAYDINVTTGVATALNPSGPILYPYCSAVNFMGRIIFKDFFFAPSVYYDGTTFGLSGYTIGGSPPVGIYQPNVYKSRIYFIGGASAYYGGVQAVTGALTQVDFSPFLTLGGGIFYAGSTTKQGLQNNSYFVVVSQRGEVLLYSGEFPGDASWGLVGHFYMPPPSGYDSFFNFGADLLIITVGGLVRLSDVLNGSTPLIPMSQKINDQFIAGIANTLYVGGANGTYFPAGNMIIINIPTQVNGSGIPSSTDQYVYNVNNGSWWRWTGILANTWQVFQNKLYFLGAQTAASDTVVCNGYTGNFDENLTTLNGTPNSRNIKLRPAYNYFGDPDTPKQFTKARPTILQDNGLQLTMDADVDYANIPATSTEKDGQVTGALQIYQPVIGLTGKGRSASIRIDQTVTAKQMSIQAIEVTYNEGDLPT